MPQIHPDFQEIIDSIASDSNTLSVSVIGSAVTCLDNLDKARDIDLFVVKETSNGFEREVKMIHNKEYDISYIDVDDLNKLIIKDNHFWLNILSKAKHLFKRNSLIEGYFHLANRMYMAGPNAITDPEQTYIRFKMTKQVEDLTGRIDHDFEFQYLANVYLPDMLRSYFKLQGTWIPRDKKMIDFLFNSDLVLYELVKATYKAQSTTDHLRLIDDVVLYILKPYGGKLSLLERCTLPIYE